MAIRYYSLHETLSLLKNKGLNLSTIVSHVREKTIHPLVYIDSIPAHACELSEDGNTAIPVGFCCLSAKWDVGNQIIALADNLIKSRTGIVEIEPKVNKSDLLSDFNILGWRYDRTAFSRLPQDKTNPQPYSDDLQITYFILLSQDKISASISLHNIVITPEDFQLLRDECTSPTIQLGPHMAYHWSGNDRKIDTTREYNQLLETKGWFNSPKTALEYRYMHEIKTWSVRQACFLLSNQNPEPATKNYSKEADHILTLIEQDHLSGVIALKKIESIRGNGQFTADNITFIKWGLTRGIDLPQTFLELLNHSVLNSKNEGPKQNHINSAAQLGRIGAKKSNAPHRKAKATALRFARKTWKEQPAKIKEDVVALIQGELITLKIFNSDNPYSDKTISGWIKPALPKERRKGGRPAKPAT